jgi:protocatechuate 3,4-dioxygenase, alpha subunit
MARLGETPSQTVGPYFSMRLIAPNTNCLVGPDTEGRIRVDGRVLDGDRHPIEDALVELWQANTAGRYRHPEDSREEIPLDSCFTGFGRAATAFATGEYWFETVKPGRIPGPGGAMQAPHLGLIVQGRGMLNPVFTRVYFADEPDANSEDPVLRATPADRRATLLASRADDATYRFDIRFQGSDETVFFDFR